MYYKNKSSPYLLMVQDLKDAETNFVFVDLFKYSMGINLLSYTIKDKSNHIVSPTKKEHYKLFSCKANLLPNDLNTVWGTLGGGGGGWHNRTHECKINIYMYLQRRL